MAGPFVEHRIRGRGVIRLVAKWLAAGVLEGAVIRPLLANIHLRHVYDQWVNQWRQRCATGDVIVVRYTDNSIFGFEQRKLPV